MNDETKREVIEAFKFIFKDSNVSTRAFYSGMFLVWLTYHRNTILSEAELDEVMGVGENGK